LELNGIEATVIAGAVDSCDGRLDMEINRMDYGHRVSKRGQRPESEHVEVDAFSVPTLLGMLGWDRIGLLKVDIEGHEKALLSESNDWINRVDCVCIECHDDFGQFELCRLAERFRFLPPERLPGIWLLRRQSGMTRLPIES
jgi:FkbM family methyltransferase